MPFRQNQMNSPFQLILLPGLGADHRLLEPQRAAFPQLIVPPWIPPRKNESLPQYAARMAETVSPSPDVPLVLGGVSFGGMLACEMAQYLEPKAVVLIASCRTRRSLRPIYTPGRWLLPFVPVQAWNIVKLLSGPLLRIKHRRSAAKREMLIAMFQDADPRFLHWIVQALLRWEATPLGGIPVYHIHGRRDPVIPARRVKPDRMIPNGSHLINLTHADEVNSFILRVLAMSQEMQRFRDNAMQYCALIDSLANGKPDRFYDHLHACMSRLASSAVDLPQEVGDATVETASDSMTHEDWGRIVTQINHAIGPEVERLIAADADDTESATRVFMLSDALADIYRDLSDGVKASEDRSQGGTQEAIWQWRFGYEYHWGLHLFDALHTVHRIRYELHEA
jgi:pimeloyl-ACP methyl ester carboxylesterase